MPIKIKIAKPGFDFKTENNPKNLIFDSSLNHLKSAAFGTLSQAMTSFGNNTQSVGHSLGFRPMVLAYFRDTSNGNWFICMANPEQTTGRNGITANVELRVTSTQIQFEFQNNQGISRTIEIQYEVFYEGA